MARHWCYIPEGNPVWYAVVPTTDSPLSPDDGHCPNPHTNLGDAEHPPPPDWMDYRFKNHPYYNYHIADDDSVYRAEVNGWGAVVHQVRAGEKSEDEVREIYHTGHDTLDDIKAKAKEDGHDLMYMLDRWAFCRPGPHWRVVREDIPWLFHPPVIRGTRYVAAGKPFLPREIHRGDGDQDRPNEADEIQREN